MSIISSKSSTVNTQYKPSLADHWADFLDKPEWRWSLYGHFTFRDRNPDEKGLRKFVHPESGGKMWDGFIHTMNKEIFGNRYYKRKNDGVVWARATELQVRGALHYHAIIGRVPGTLRRLDYVDEWNRVAGFARLYAYEAGKGAEHYLSKSCYAWKHGEIDLGGPLVRLIEEKQSAGLFG